MLMPSCTDYCREKLIEACVTARGDGYAFLSNEIIEHEIDPQSKQDFLDSIATVPQEAFANPHNIRSRWVSYGYVDYMNGKLWIDHPSHNAKSGTTFSQYNLMPDTNPELAGVNRQYEPMPLKVRENACFKKLVYLGYLMSPVHAGDSDNPALQRFQAHLIRFTPREGIDSVATPDAFHQDDDFAFCVYLLERNNVEGGVNYFAPLDCSGMSLKDAYPKVLCEKTLLNPFSAYTVNDRIVSHYVSSIASRGDGAARSILILSFKPMKVDDVVSSKTGIGISRRLSSASESLMVEKDAVGLKPW